MKPEVEQALRESIVKWERNAQVKTLSAATLGQEDCPLCQISKDKLGNVDCCRCPVFKRTEQHGCLGTPYHDASETKRQDNLEMFRLFAQDEVAFLRSLLP
ncbi:MAG TPA: hypothetical protein VK181_11870 [Rhizobium sp.]|nr:hypothetical protein [Rhizobium sp.]